MKDLFAPFERFYQPIHIVIELVLPDSNTMLDMQMKRLVWIRGITSNEPDVKVPMFWHGIGGVY